MIALDTSALIAILLEEPDGDVFAEVLKRADGLLIGMPTLLELRMVLTGRVGRARADTVVNTILADEVQRIAFGEEHLRAAVDAFDRFGKGRRHPAQLNFGDCMAYAVAKVAGCPLLYKGDDFAATDIRSALDG